MRKKEGDVTRTVIIIAVVVVLIGLFSNSILVGFLDARFSRSSSTGFDNELIFGNDAGFQDESAGGESSCVGVMASDINLDGAVDVQDLTAVIFNWHCVPDDGTCQNPGADVNGDNYVNTPDLNLVITYWGNIDYCACNDGTDNDGDGLIDFPEDSGCEDVEDDDEYNGGVASVCGNGVCDFFGGENFANCIDDCSSSVFATSDRWYGHEIEGLSGADFKCQEVAESVGLEGEWKAWISASDEAGENVATRIHHNLFEGYALLDGTLLAESWEDLVDGSLLNDLNVDENVETITNNYGVWTATNFDGTADGKDCGDWTSSGPGRRGLASQTNGAWTDHSSDVGCTTSLNRLYCFEQLQQQDGGVYSFDCSEGTVVVDQEGVTLVLEEDIQSSGNCLIVEANGVTIDGQSHSITGSNSGFAISVNGVDNVVIKNLEFNEFASVVEFEDVTNSLIKDVVFNSPLDTGIKLVGSNNNVVDSNVVFLINAASYGIRLIDSNENEISENLVEGGFISGISLRQESSNNEIINNIVNFNQQYGLNLKTNSNYNVIIDNEFGHNQLDNVQIESDYNLFRDNLIVGLTDGDFDDTLSVFGGSYNTFIDNVVSGGHTGIRLQVGASHNTFTGGLLDNINGDAILLTGSGFMDNNLFENIEIGNADKVVTFSSVEVGRTIFIGFLPAGSYSFGEVGGLLTYDNSPFGIIEFLEPVNGAGENLQGDIRIFQNLAIVDVAENPGLDRPANIGLNNVGPFSSPIVFKNNAPCSLEVCVPIEDFVEGGVFDASFYVPDWSGQYSIGDEIAP